LILFKPYADQLWFRVRSYEAVKARNGSASGVKTMRFIKNKWFYMAALLVGLAALTAFKFETKKVF